MNDRNVKCIDKLRFSLKHGNQTEKMVSEYGNVCAVITERIENLIADLDKKFDAWERNFAETDMRSATLNDIAKVEEINSIFQKLQLAKKIRKMIQEKKLF